MVDSALQGTIGMIEAATGMYGKAALPFALERIAIYAPCTPHMTAWIRYTGGGAGQSTNLVKVDIDLCDAEGRVCVRMDAFASRSVEGMESEETSEEARLQTMIRRVLNNELSIDEAVEFE